MKKIVLICMLGLIGFTAVNKKSYALFGFGKKNKNQVVQLKGSDTILNVSQAVAEEFMKENKGARIAVTGGGSGTGIAAIINKTIDIAMASREMKSSEFDKATEAGLSIEEVTIGYDGITVVVNNDNPVKDLSLEEIRAIFIGEITNWKEVGGEDREIIVLSRDSSSGTHAYFKEEVLRQGKKDATDEYSTKALFLPSNEALKQEVRESKGAIAYIGMGYMDNTVHSVKVEGVEASFENVSSKEYPIARGVYWYVQKGAEGSAKELVDFILSSKGQEIVKREGFVPVK